jgi:hypothetical protein
MVRRTYKGRKKNGKVSRRAIKGGRHLTRRRRSNRKYTGGGVRFGTGIGSNCHDPNKSIFNTNLLKLFPYKP